MHVVGGVVQAVAANDAVKTVSSFERIEQLIVDRKSWEQGAMRTSNAQLYALLGKCYELYFEMKGFEAAAKDMRKTLDAVVAKNGYKFNEGTHYMTRIVKCVFGVDRRRVSAYSLVLREALAQEKKASEIAAFIVAGGGVEEIRRSASPNAVTAKDKVELGKQVVGSKELGVMNGEKLAEKLDVDNVGEDMVAIVTQQADGSFIVRAVIKSKTVLKAALTFAYSENKAAAVAAAKNAKPAEGDKKLADAIVAAATS